MAAGNKSDSPELLSMKKVAAWLNDKLILIPKKTADNSGMQELHNPANSITGIVAYSLAHSALMIFFATIFLPIALVGFGGLALRGAADYFLEKDSTRHKVLDGIGYVLSLPIAAIYTVGGLIGVGIAKVAKGISGALGGGNAGGKDATESSSLGGDKSSSRPSSPSIEQGSKLDSRNRPGSDNNITPTGASAPVTPLRHSNSSSNSNSPGASPLGGSTEERNAPSTGGRRNKM